MKRVAANGLSSVHFNTDICIYLLFLGILPTGRRVRRYSKHKHDAIVYIPLGSAKEFGQRYYEYLDYKSSYDRCHHVATRQPGIKDTIYENELLLEPLNVVSCIFLAGLNGIYAQVDRSGEGYIWQKRYHDGSCLFEVEF